MRFAVIGLGEAGATYARGLQERGADVVGFDVRVALDDVRSANSASEAASGADVVLSLVRADAAYEVAAEVAPVLGDALFADLNTGSAALKLELEGVIGDSFADVAVMAPVARAGVRTRLLTSGPGATRFADAVSEFDVPIEIVSSTSGDAAGLKLLRSVFVKGLAAVAFEAYTAADQRGVGDWILAEMAGELGPDGAELVDHLLAGTRRHAERRLHEMQAAREHLASIGSPTWMTEASALWLERIAADSEI